MPTIAPYFQQQLHAHRAQVDAARAAAPALNIAAITQLASVACLLLLLAAIGYFAQGYQVAFQPINSLASHIPEWVLHNLTVFGDGTLILTLVLLIATRRVQFHWAVFWAAIFGAIVSNGLKDFFDAARPPAVLDAGAFVQMGKAYTQHSFPSGHTLTAFLIASVGYYFVDRPWQKGALLLGGVGVGLSRIWLGIHWPMDTLVGGALGIFCGCAAIVLAHRWQSGLNPVMHRVILGLLMVAAVMSLTVKNDYHYALPLLYVAALAALWRTLTCYFLPTSDTHRSPLAADAVKLPLTNTWLPASTVFWWFLALITLYRLLVLLQPQFSLFYDEAYYYHWSLNPDLGYYSKPPMVAWFILLSTSLLGDTVFAIKMMASLAYGAAAVVLFYTAKRYSNASQGLLAGLIFLCIPMVGFNSEFITTDAPLLLFWALALHFALRAIEHQQLSHWLLLGVFTGLGMLSKYTMGAFPLAVFGFLLAEKKHRATLLTAGPWLAAVTAGLIFGLNIYWNFTHQWIAAQHTQEISHTTGPVVNFGSLAEFLAVQFLIFGPVFSWLLVWGVKKSWSAPSLADTQLPFAGFYRLLAWVTAAMLVVIGLQAFLSHAFPNWAGPWMVAGTLLLVFGWRQAYSAQVFYRRLGYGIATNLILLSLFYHWPQTLHWLSIEATAKNDPFHRLLGWPELGALSKPLLEQYPDAKLASDSRDILAYIGYYGRPGSFDFARWNPNAENIRDYYDLMVNLRNYAGDMSQSYVFVSKSPLSDAVLSRFAETQYLDKVTTAPYEGDQMSLYLTFLRGFKGYE